MRRARQARTRKGRKASFGCVYRLRRRDGSEYATWSVRFIEAGERVQRGGFATRDAAESFLARQRVEQSERRALGLPELQRVSVEKAVEDYLDWSKEHRRPRTHKSNATYLKAFAAKWGKRDVLSLTGDDVTRALEETPAFEGRMRRYLAQSSSAGPSADRPRELAPSSVVESSLRFHSMSGGTLGPYRLDRELGVGGMGKVWSARVEGRVPGLDVGVVVALKLVHSHLVETPGFFQRFLREAEIGRAVVHENVVRTLECGQVVVDGRPQSFLVMEFVEGRTLDTMAKEMGRVPEELCRHLGREIAKGLAAIHAAGAVHRDLKPANVLVTPGHAVKVMDLGVARLVDESVRLSQSGAFVGSVEYAAPEQFRSPGEVDARADLHALGLVLYELATGVNPYHGDDFREVMHRVLESKPRRAGELNPQLSPFFEEVVHKLIAKQREERFASADEVAGVLGEGEQSAWWRERASSIRAETKRPLRRIRIPRETALHGRDAELARLRALFDDAAAGDGRVLLVEGEAGIGKSRLVDEFVGRLQIDGRELNFLFGSYPPGGAATAAGAFSTAYREHFGDGGSSAYLAETPVLVRAFDALLRGETTPPGVVPLSKDSLQTCFVHATRSLAAERPTIVLIDDLHFAPEEGRALFAALALAVPDHRVLLVGTTRPGLDEKWLTNVERIGAKRMSLPRLGAKELARLLADAFRSKRLAEELGVKIALKSDGNPFFVFEILQGLRDGQFITKRDDGTWATTRAIEEIQVPSSVLDLVQARVADLSRDERNALDVASCLGFEFDPPLVAAVLGVGKITLLQNLAHVEKAHRLVRSAGRRFVFDHHQVQEALYGGLPEMLREEYHSAIAVSLEAQSGAAARRPDEVDGALCVGLAEHFLAGGRGRESARYLEPAVAHLGKGNMHGAAVRLAGRALAVPGLLAGRERISMLLLKIGRLRWTGDADAERAALDEAVALLPTVNDESLAGRVIGALGGFQHHAGRHAEAVSSLRQAIASARVAGDRKEEAHCLGRLAKALINLERLDQARECLDAQLVLAREIGDVYSEAQALGNTGNVLRLLGRNAEARNYHARQREFCRGKSDRGGEAMAIANLALMDNIEGESARALEGFARQLEIAREIGERRSEADALVNSAVALSNLGRWGEALEVLDRHLPLARELGDRHGEAVAEQNLGNALRLLGRVAEARGHAEAAIALSRELALQRLESSSLQVLARAVAEDDPGKADGIVSEAIQIRRSLNERKRLALSLLPRGIWRAETSRWADARADLVEAFEIATAPETKALHLEASAAAALAWVDVASGEHASASSGPWLARALDALGRLDAAREPEDALEANWFLWRATGERAHLAEAVRFLHLSVAGLPDEFRASALSNVRLRREIRDAWEASGAGSVQR